MTEAPERIWAWVWNLPYPSKSQGKAEWNRDAVPTSQDVTEYIRADLVDPAAIREAALREAVEAVDRDVLGGKTARAAILALIDKKEG